jgi:dTDP-4-amino-4,6-dideoxygalactose transaminase
MIPMVDLKTQYLSLKQEIDAAVLDVLANTQFILGPNVKGLEHEIQSYLTVNHAISCASGTDALHLALRAAGIGPGDEVITTAFTFIATAEAIAYVGAKPVFVDIEPDSFNIDADKIEEAISAKTRAVIAVHLFGLPADLGPIAEVCSRHRLTLIEDCAQSFGALYGGTRTGAIGAMGCFSFFPSKNLGGYGDGGLITASAEDHAKSLLSLRNHGSQVRYYHDEIGYNSRLDELQAAILRVKFRHIDRFNDERRRVARAYTARLGRMPVQTPIERADSTHVFHQYTILTDQRERLMQRLSERQIASAVYYPVPLHRQKAFGSEFSSVQLPVTERVSQQCLSLPIYPEMTESQIDEVAEVIGSALQ